MKNNPIIIMERLIKVSPIFIYLLFTEKNQRNKPAEISNKKTVAELSMKWKAAIEVPIFAPIIRPTTSSTDRNLAWTNATARTVITELFSRKRVRVIPKNTATILNLRKFFKLFLALTVYNFVKQRLNNLTKSGDKNQRHTYLFITQTCFTDQWT